MKPTIVFILTSVNSSHDKNRVEEFINNGFPVRVYGFIRDGNNTPLAGVNYDVTPLGHIHSQRYVDRLRTYAQGIRQVVNDTKKGKVLYYLPSLDVAMVFRFLYPCKKYLYELCDLMQSEMGHPFLQHLLNIADRVIIRRATLAVVTSEGFIHYHFGKQTVQPVVLVPNRLHPSISDYPVIPKKTNINHLRIAFVGNARYKTIMNVAKVIGERFPQHEFHFYGTTNDKVLELKERFANVYVHGRFANPKDLPSIYSQVDLLICTYDVTTDNVRYAEPNKLYEAIYFETPIVVSSGTFLSEKVDQLGIGFDVDAMNDEQIAQFIENLTPELLVEKQRFCQAIPKSDCINLNPNVYVQLSRRYDV